jgi:predicted MFS family arabinose efflux permease
MGKRIMAILGGLATATVAIFIMEIFMRMLYPVPQGIDLKNKEALAEMLRNMPSGAFLFLLLAYAVGSTCGGMVAAALSPDKKTRSALIMGAVLTIGAILNLTMVPHPVWFMVANLLIYEPFAVLGAFVMQKIKQDKL